MFIEILFLIKSAAPQEALLPLGALGVAGVAEAYRFWQGRNQLQAAKDFANKTRPISDVPIPQGVLENTRLARNSYGTSGLPGQSAIDNSLDASIQSGADSLIATGHGADTAAGIAALENSKMMAKAGMAKDAASLQLGKLATLIGTNSELGGYQAKKYEADWNWNERDPYLQSMAAASAMKNSGEANTFNSISNIATLASGAMALDDGGGGNVDNMDYSPAINEAGYGTPSNDVNGAVDLRNPGQGQYDFNTPANSGALDQSNNAVREQMILDLQSRFPQFTVEQIQQMLSGR